MRKHDRDPGQGEVGDWYVYDDQGAHRGPFTSEQLIAAIRSRDVAELALIAPNMWFESLGASGWRIVRDIPELSQLLEASIRADELKQRKPPPRLVHGAFTTTARGTPEFGATAMIHVGDPDAPPDEG